MSEGGSAPTEVPYPEASLLYPKARPGRRHINQWHDVLPPFHAFRRSAGGTGPEAPTAGASAAAPSEGEPTLPPLWGVEPNGIGISLSGGGIRSASYGLGVLQAMATHGMLFGPVTSNPNRAKYLSAVSGGSYIATALTTVATGSIGAGDPSVEWTNEIPDFTPRPGTMAPNLSPFAPGSPEEQRLRNRALYLTHGRGGIPAALWRLFLGILLNTAFVAASLATIGLPLGWLYQKAWPSLRTGCTVRCEDTAAFTIPHQLWVATAILAALSLLAGLWWLLERTGGTRQSVFGVTTGALLCAAIALLTLWIALPALLHVLSFNNPTVTAQVTQKAADTKDQQATAGVVLGVGASGLAALVATWLAAAKRLLATPLLGKSGVGGKLAAVAERHRTLVMNLLATLAGPLLVLTAIVGYAWVGARYPIGWSSNPQRVELIGWAFSIAAALFALWRMDVTTWSLFPYYRRRLSSAFVLGRIRRAPGAPQSPTAFGDIDADERPYEISYDVSKFSSPNLPEVLICASANISDYGETPTGSNVTSFVFSPTLIGGPLVGAIATNEYEAHLKKGRRYPSPFATLPTAMALSGAAISPSMGRMTRSPYRLLMALANLRLGAWVPNPRRLEKFSKSLLEPRPGPQYFVREMIGRNHLDAPFLYITDGGHYENLGLVELLRRKCKTIWTVDASGDQIGTFDTFGGALRTAAAELGVAVDINPETMAPAEHSRFVKVPFVKGTITYADGTTASLVVVKAGVPEDAPWSVRSYHSSHPGFPCDPTLDQLYDAERFEAYRELGHHCASVALDRYGPLQDRA